MKKGKLTGIEDYRGLVSDSVIERIKEKAKKLKNVHVAHLNSTLYGGGVAELLSSLTLLMNSAGVKTGWRVIQGSPDFFSVTKKMHNALQGGEINLTRRKKEIYEHTVFENSVRNHIDHDFLIVHDPQPLSIIQHYKKKCPWIWQCHLEFSNPDRKLWNYIKPFIERYDAVILSLEDYKRKINTPQLFFMPAIDPFSIKNKKMSENETAERLRHYKIPRDLPLVVQISRFDKWKDPEGVIKAFKIAQKHVDARLVLLGNVAMDDPEGEKVYKSLLDERSDRIIILSAEDTALVNALQRRATVVLQKSIREGFGLTVTEAMWKGAAVIGADTGGIKHQIEDGKDGFLVSGTEEAAEKIVKLIEDKKLRERIGREAKNKVKKKFLLIRLLEQYIDLLGSFETLFRLKK